MERGAPQKTFQGLPCKRQKGSEKETLFPSLAETTLDRLEFLQNKKPLPFGNGLLVLCKLDSAGYFTRTQATGAGVDVARSTIYNCLHTSYIWFPGSVGSSVRVRNLDTESNAFSADIAFSH